MLGRPQALRGSTNSARSVLVNNTAHPRHLTHYEASTSTTLCPQRASIGQRQRQRGVQVVARALFDPPPFQPEKLRIQFAPGTSQLEPAPPLRRYTLTHNDVTGDLSLTIGSDYNHKQISGFYTRLLRDEVTAEWKHSGPSYALHVYCHVSGEERWLAPPMLRNYIFRREMPLVLDTFLYADAQLFQSNPYLKGAPVYIHFQSSVQELDTVELWGQLGDRSSWSRVPTSILLRLLYSVLGWPAGQRQEPAALSMDHPMSISSDDDEQAPSDSSSTDPAAAHHTAVPPAPVAAGSSSSNTSQAGPRQARSSPMRTSAADVGSASNGALNGVPLQPAAVWASSSRESFDAAVRQSPPSAWYAQASVCADAAESSSLQPVLAAAKVTHGDSSHGSGSSSGSSSSGAGYGSSSSSFVNGSGLQGGPLGREPPSASSSGMHYDSCSSFTSAGVHGSGNSIVGFSSSSCGALGNSSGVLGTVRLLEVVMCSARDVTPSRMLGVKYGCKWPRSPHGRLDPL